ncbi:MAG: Crp/Fnr family transcriptional regulator [Rhodospirillaceae bacterium BRH_c57]|nr:MAG: Crp/Fnr family transcriptional regulator [Rhodospirillaceae bacterium BRH_c57]
MNIEAKFTRTFDPIKFLEEVGNGRTVHSHVKQDVVFLQGDQADTVFYIHSGQVKITVVSEFGKEAVIAVLGPKAFFGEGCLTVQPHRLSTATAMTDCQIMAVDKAVIARAIRDEPALSVMFISYLLARTTRLEEDLVDHLLNPSEKRLARTLMLLANLCDGSERQHTITNVSQEMLADMIGTTRSRVSQFMNRFRKLGFIDYSHDNIKVNVSLLNVVPNNISGSDSRTTDGPLR